MYFSPYGKYKCVLLKKALHQVTVLCFIYLLVFLVTWFIFNIWWAVPIREMNGK